MKNQYGNSTKQFTKQQPFVMSFLFLIRYNLFINLIIFLIKLIFYKGVKMRSTHLKKKTQKYWLSKLDNLEFNGELLEALSNNEGNTPSEKLLNYLFNITSELMYATDEEQAKKFDLAELFASYSFANANPNIGGRTIHLETDIRDDLLGFKPKVIRNILTTFGVEGLKALPGILWALNFSVQINPRLVGLYFDGESSSLDWDSMLKDHFVENSFSHPLAKSFFFYLQALLDKEIKHDEKSREFFLANPFLFYYFSNKERISFSDIEEEMDKRAKHWREVHKVVPQSKCMLFVTPEKFSPALLPVIEEIFGSKQIGRLSSIAQWKASVLIESFGELLLELPIECLKHGYVPNVILGSNIKIASKDTVNLYLSLLSDKTTAGDVVSLSRSATALSGVTPEFIKKIKRIPDAKDLLEILFNSSLQSKFVNDPIFMSFILEETNPRDLKVIKDYYGNLPASVLDSAHSLWISRKREQKVPLLSGRVDDYSWEIIDTTKDASGLWLGNATDCCQAFQNAAESCVKAGYIDPKCSFIAVRKNGKVYAQTFLWVSLEDGIAAFDSIEMLSRSASQNPKIMKCFLEAAAELIKHKEDGFDIHAVITGASGTTLPQGLSDYNIPHKILNDNFFELNSDDVRSMQRHLYGGSGVYTDCLQFFTLAIQNSNCAETEVIFSNKGKNLMEEYK